MPTYTLAATTSQITTGFWGFNRNNSSQVNLPNVNITGALDITPTYNYPVVVTTVTLWMQVRASGATYRYVLGTTATNISASTGTFSSPATGALVSRNITTPSGGWATFADRTWYYGWIAPSATTSFFGRADAGGATEYANNGIYQENADGTTTLAYTTEALTGSLVALLVPSAPTVTLNTTTSSSITVNWTAPTDNGGATITYYRIAYKRAVDTTWTWAATQVASSLSYTVTGLISSTSYNIVVAAINSVCDTHNGTTAPTGYNDVTSTTGTNGTLTASTAGGTFVKVYNGTAWVNATVKARNGASWDTGVVKRWTGTAWSTT